MFRVLLAPLALAAAFGSWGIGWGLPSRARLERVLPGADSPALRARLTQGWTSMREAMGPAILLSSQSWSGGFVGTRAVEPGWVLPPPALENTARSFYLRSCQWDEPNILYGLSLLKPSLSGINPGVYWYGAAYLYPLGAWIVAGAALTPARLVRSVSFYMEEPERMAWLYLLGRSFMVFLFVALTAAVGFTAHELGGATAGWWAAMFCAAAPALVVQAHILKPHLMAASCVVWAMFFCVRALRKQNPRQIIAAGVFGGLAAGCAVNQGACCVFIPLALLLACRRGWIAPAQALRWTVMAAAAAVAAFLVTNPFFITQPRQSLAAMRIVSGLLNFGFSKLLAVVLTVLPASLTWGVYLLALLGLARAAREDDDGRRLAAFGTLIMVGATVSISGVGPLSAFKYFIGAGLLPVLAGLAVAHFWSRRWMPAAATLALLPALATSAVYCGNFGRDGGTASNRWAAGSWIEKNVPGGAEIAILRAPQPLNIPYFALNRYRLTLIEPAAARTILMDKSPEWFILLYPGYDDRAELGREWLGRYELAARFDFWGPRVLQPPLGDFEANAPIEIFHRRRMLSPKKES